MLVGDIRDYTVLVRRAPSAELQRSVSSVFERLDDAVADLGGTVKEHQGDAILAFWEGNLSGSQFRFRHLGTMTAKGFEQPDEVFALEGLVIP